MAKIIRGRKKGHKKLYFILLSPFKNRIIKYLKEKNIAFDPYNDESIYYEFYNSIRPQTVETDKPINNNVPAMTHPDYYKRLKKLDWKAIFHTIKSFFILLANKIVKKSDKGEEINDTEKELVIKTDQLNKEMKEVKNKLNEIDQSKSQKLPLLIALGLGIYLLTKK